MNSSVSCLFIILIGIFPLPLQAKKSKRSSSHRIQFRQLSNNDGLSHSSVNDIIQDRMGFLWIATEKGLNRYDGYEFVQFFGMDGLPNDQVKSLLETRDGMIWLGTRDGGIAQLDPRSLMFEKYEARPGQPNSMQGVEIETLYEDRAGNLWVGDRRSGLQRLDRDTDTWYSFPKQLAGLGRGGIYGMLEDQQGRLWVASSEGLYELEELSWSATGEWTGTATRHALTDDPTDREVIYSMCLNPKGGLCLNLWNQGLVYLNPDQGSQTLIEAEPKVSNHLFSNQIKDMMFDRDGKLWVCNFDGGLSYRETETGGFTHFRHEAGNALHLKSNYTTSIYQDRTGIIWVGTYGSGLNHYSPYRDKFALYQQQANNPNSLSYDQVFAITESRIEPSGNLWIGTHGSGLNLMLSDPETGQEVFRHFNHSPEDAFSLSYPAALAVEEDHLGNIWIGTYKGLNRLSVDQATALLKGEEIHARFERFLPDSPRGNGLEAVSIWSLLRDRQDRLWVGTQKGVYQFLPEQNRFAMLMQPEGYANPLSRASVISLYQDQQDRLWLGTSKGLYLIVSIPKTGETAHAIRFVHDSEDATGLQSDWIYGITEDLSGRIWIGTRGGGLHLFQEKSPIENSHFFHVGEAEGLSSNSIRSLEVDSRGVIWASTTQGLCSFHPDSLLNGHPATIRSFDRKDGLQGNEFNEGASTIGRDGRMYFGGLNGLNAFYPEEVQDNPLAPEVYLTGIRILDRDIGVGGTRTDGKRLLQQDLASTEHLELSYQDYSFTLFFSALDFSLPEKNQYAYQLEGFDEQWRRNGTVRSATYTNLDPGDYVFRIRASNHDGHWNTAERQIRISISPPPWKTWWAYLLYALAIIGLFSGYVRFRIREREQQYETQRRIEHARQEEREEVRKRTAADFHDELGHKMTKISLFVELAKRTAPAQEVLNRYLEQVSDQTQILSEGIRDFVWVLDPDKDSLFDAVLRLKDFGEDLFAHTEIGFRTQGFSDALEAIRLPVQMRRHVVLLFKEAMNNSLKYAEASEVQLGVRQTETHFHLFCQDDGKGMEDGKAKGGGYGLSNMRSRAEQMGGQLEIVSSIGQGIRISLDVPIPQMGD